MTLEDRWHHESFLTELADSLHTQIHFLQVVLRMSSKRNTEKADSTALGNGSVAAAAGPADSESLPSTAPVAVMHGLGDIRVSAPVAASVVPQLDMTNQSKMLSKVALMTADPSITCAVCKHVLRDPILLPCCKVATCRMCALTVAGLAQEGCVGTSAWSLVCKQVRTYSTAAAAAGTHPTAAAGGDAAAVAAAAPAVADASAAVGGAGAAAVPQVAAAPGNVAGATATPSQAAASASARHGAPSPGPHPAFPDAATIAALPAAAALVDRVAAFYAAQSPTAGRTSAATAAVGLVGGAGASAGAGVDSPSVAAAQAGKPAADAGTVAWSPMAPLAGTAEKGAFCCMDEDSVPATAWCMECAEHYCNACWTHRHIKKLATHARAPVRLSGCGTCPIHSHVPLDAYCRRKGRAICRLCVLESCADHEADAVQADDLAVTLGGKAADLRSAAAAWDGGVVAVRALIASAQEASAATAAQLTALEKRLTSRIAARFTALRTEAADGWRARIDALEAQATRMAAVQAGASELARIYDAAVPVGRAHGTTPLLPVQTFDHLTSAAAAVAGIVTKSSAPWGVLPAADVNGCVLAHEASIDEGLQKACAAVTLQWGLPAPVGGRLVPDPAGSTGIRVQWSSPELAPGQTPPTHWLVRWSADASGVAADTSADVTAEGVAAARAGDVARSIVSLCSGNALLAADEDSVTFTAKQALQLLDPRRAVELQVAAIRMPAAGAGARATGVATGSGLLAAAPKAGPEAGPGIPLVTPLRLVPSRRNQVVVAQRPADAASYQGYGEAQLTTKLRLTAPNPVWLYGFQIDTTYGASGIIKLFRHASAPVARQNATQDPDVGFGGDAPLATAVVPPTERERRAGTAAAYRAADFARSVLVEPGVDYCVLFVRTSTGASSTYAYRGDCTRPMALYSSRGAVEVIISVAAGTISRDSPAVTWHVSDEQSSSSGYDHYDGHPLRYRVITAVKFSLASC